MEADPSAQLALLDVQELDSRLDLLRAQAQSPPEAVELRDLSARLGTVDGRMRDLQVEVDDLSREQRKADDDVEQVKARRQRDQQRLDSGAVSNPKDLERLQHELVSLERRISDLEDVELEVMERLEIAQAELRARGVEAEELRVRGRELTATRDQRVAGLREEAEQVARERATAVQGVPADLLALYERLREQKGGVGAAALRARRCEGCRMELNSSELAALGKLPPHEVSRCDECGRILIRTGESGL